MSMSAVSEKETYLRDFEALKQESAPDWLSRLRQSAMENFLSLEFPSTKNEDWRFTSIAPIVKTDFRTFADADKPDIAQIRAHFLGSEGANHRIVFVNGRFSQELSAVTSLPKGVVIGSFSGSNIPIIEEHLGQYARFDQNIFTALNTGLFQDAAVLYLPEGHVMESPIELLFVSTARENALINPRILIITGKASSTNIVESYVGFGDVPYLCNVVTEIVLGEGSIVEHCKVQKENQGSYHLSTTRVHQYRDSTYTSLLVTLGSKLSRNELNVVLNGTGASCNLNGLYLIDGSQHADHQTTIDHARPNGTSQELYKGILDGASHAVFNGKIIVRKDAQRTDAKQTNKNLLLADGARVNTKPQLEILADDVKCNHGATIGHLEEEALFYLRSRGMSARLARMLLMQGFINDVTGRLKSERVRTWLEVILSGKLQQFVERKEAA